METKQWSDFVEYNIKINKNCMNLLVRFESSQNASAF